MSTLSEFRSYEKDDFLRGTARTGATLAGGLGLAYGGSKGMQYLTSKPKGGKNTRLGSLYQRAEKGIRNLPKDSLRRSAATKARNIGATVMRGIRKNPYVALAGAGAVGGYLGSKLIPRKKRRRGLFG